MSFQTVMSDLFVPTVGLSDRFEGFWSTLQTKFPYSLANSLQIGDASGSSYEMPSNMGIFVLPSAQLEPLFIFIRVAATVVIYALIILFLVDRFTPQNTI